MYVERHAVTITTDASGDGTGYTPTVTGQVLAIVYAKTDYANGVDMTVTAESTGQAILALTDQNASGTFYPRQQVHGPTGAGLTLNGTQTVNEPVAVANDRAKIVVAQGGNTKSGTFHVLVG